MRPAPRPLARAHGTVAAPRVTGLWPCPSSIRPTRMRHPPRGGAHGHSPLALTAAEQQLHDVWNDHLRAECSAHSADAALATMGLHPRVNQVPVLIGGEGRDELYAFYAHDFLPQIPPDLEMVPVSRTIGHGRLVEELVAGLPSRSPWSGCCRAPRRPGSGSRSRWWWSYSLTATSWRTSTCSGTRPPCWCGWGACRREGCRSSGPRGTIGARSAPPAQGADPPRQGPLIAAGARWRASPRRRPASGVAWWRADEGAAS